MSRLELISLEDFPLVEPGDDLVELIESSLQQNGLTLQHGDILVLAQKIISKSEGRYVFLDAVVAGEEAIDLAEKTDKDPRLVELILAESCEVIKHRSGAIIVEHKLGYVHANAGIDQSNIASTNGRDRVLLLPENPDASAQEIRQRLQSMADISVIITDSAGRAWRNGITGFAIGTAGFDPLVDLIGKTDLMGRPLQVTQIAVADELAAAASFMMGQADEGIPVVLIRGAHVQPSNEGSDKLIRAREQDLFR